MPLLDLIVINLITNIILINTTDMTAEFYKTNTDASFSAYFTNLTVSLYHVHL